MGFSFGYNRNEDIEDYNSAQAMVLMLCDLVSQGGNLLLDIGPDERGRIPVIMQERLLEIGQWLEINGEAIYGTRRWKDAVQWTEGERDCKDEDQNYVGGDYILKQTISPVRPECAVKEVFYTYKDGDLYAIAPKWPGDKLVLKNIAATENTKIKFLDTGEELGWESENGNIKIIMPAYDPNVIKTDLAYVFQLSNIREYSKKPKLNISYLGFGEKPIVEIEGKPKVRFYYTLDGSIPNEKSKLYHKTLRIKETVVLSCIAFEEGKNPSDIVSQNINVYDQIKELVLVHQPTERYSANGVVSLMDNERGSLEIGEGNWLGFEGVDAVMIIDLGELKEISKVTIGCLQWQASWIFTPGNIDYFVSENGKQFKRIGAYKNPNASVEGINKRMDIDQNFDGVRSRYLKIAIKNIGQCPGWHKGAGNTCWLFVDEVVID